MDGEMDWIAARFLLSTALGVHPLVVQLHDDDGEGSPAAGEERRRRRVAVPAAVEAPEGVVGVAVCAVCTEEVARGQPVVRLPCAHWYHDACIAPWLRIRPTCPTCRAELPPPPPEDHRRARAETTETPGGGRLRREASCTMLAPTLPS